MSLQVEGYGSRGCTHGDFRSVLIPAHYDSHIIDWACLYLPVVVKREVCADRLTVICAVAACDSNRGIVCWCRSGDSNICAIGQCSDYIYNEPSARNHNISLGIICDDRIAGYRKIFTNTYSHIVSAYFSARESDITNCQHSGPSSGDFSAGHSKITVIHYRYCIVVILDSANERTALQIECGTFQNFDTRGVITITITCIIAALNFAVCAAVLYCQRSLYYDDRAVIISTRQPTVNGVSIEVYRSRHTFGHIDIACGVLIARQRIGLTREGITTVRNRAENANQCLGF